MSSSDSVGSCPCPDPKHSIFSGSSVRYSFFLSPGPLIGPRSRLSSEISPPSYVPARLSPGAGSHPGRNSGGKTSRWGIGAQLRTSNGSNAAAVCTLTWFLGTHLCFWRHLFGPRASRVSALPWWCCNGREIINGLSWQRQMKEGWSSN